MDFAARIKKRWKKSFPTPNQEDFSNGLSEDESTSVLSLLTCLSPLQWALFITGYFCWVSDAYDFYCVSLTIKDLALVYERTNHEITFGISLSLLFRPLGAALFGILSDLYGRKWPLVANMLVIATFAFVTPLCANYTSFIVARSFFGLGMGGVWGLAAATAMESMPLKARGLFSGIFQPGFSLGVVLCVLVNMLVVKLNIGWRSLFYIGGGVSLFLAMSRCLLPESEAFLRKKSIQAEKDANDIIKSENNRSTSSASLVTDLFWNHSAVFLWTTALATGLSGLANGSQGIFPLFLEETKKQSTEIVSLVIIAGNAGGMIGPLISGYYSQIYGRKLLLLLSTLLTLIAIPLCIYPSDSVWLFIGHFLLQVGFQGGWGITPVYFNELAPPACKAFFAGLTYQLGVMVASPYTYLEASYGDAHQTSDGSPDYGTGMAIVLLGSCALIIGLLVFSSGMPKMQDSAEEINLDGKYGK